MDSEPITLEQALTILDQHAAQADGEPTWPIHSWQALRRAGALRWCIPSPLGGLELSPAELLSGYEQLAGACLTTIFILSQRDAACRRLRDGDNPELRERLLPQLANGSANATVGLSQLTTSRQHMQPSLSATLRGQDVVFNGTIPWVTGAEEADYIVIGGVLEDGAQILAVLQRTQAGVTVGPPLPLAALEGSLTAELRCDNVVIGREWILAGPAAQVITVGKGGTGGLETSCLALGLAGAALAYLEKEAASRPDLNDTYKHLADTGDQLRTEMHGLALGACGSADAAALRARANTLVLRTTQAALTASKGTGFLRTHPAQRWARQALFFLVWSCPRPATDATLAYLAQPEPFACA
jgi:alkylation response protein AidB-like acyl-CoA dehydrogenase